MQARRHLLKIPCRRSLSSRATGAPPISTVKSCPSPSCACEDVPEDLDIDTKSPLGGTTPAYHEHLLVATGRSNWTSRIENDEGLPFEFVRKLKGRFGRGGKYVNPFHNVMISASSLPTAASNEIQVMLFPSGKTIQGLTTQDSLIDDFIEAFLLPAEISPQQKALGLDKGKTHLRNPARQAGFQQSDVSYPVVLMCSHNSRDKRCGTIGPLLQCQMDEILRRVAKDRNFPWGQAEAPDEDQLRTVAQIRTACISHIGGHKFAGNVIVYVPSPARAGAGMHPLAGKGIWYGRVQPKHIEGIVEETICGGRVIEELFRGGVSADGSVLRLPLKSEV